MCLASALESQSLHFGGLENRGAGCFALSGPHKGPHRTTTGAEDRGLDRCLGSKEHLVRTTLAGERPG